MNKKQLELVAAVLHDHKPSAREGLAALRRWERMVGDMGKRLAATNPRFCQKKWWEKCGG